MVATVMLVNPRPKRKSAAAPRRKRKMSALQRQYFGGKRSRSRSPRAKPSAGSHIMSVQQNPQRRRRRRASRTTVRYRRNPSSGGSMSLLSTLGPAAIGAGGAIAVSYIATNYLTSVIPQSMTTGIGGAFAMGGLGVLAGWAAGKAFGRKTGNSIAAGAVTIAIYNAISPMLSGASASGGQGLLAGAGGSSYGSSYGGSSYAGSGTLAGLGKARKRRMGRFVGGMGGLGAGLPPNQAGPLQMQRARMMRQRRMAGLGYIGVARNAGVGPLGGPRMTPAMRQLGRFIPRG